MTWRKPWPPAHVAALVELWPTFSASQTAQILNERFSGAGYSRNSVIGRAGRMALQKQEHKPAEPKRLAELKAEPPRKINLPPPPKALTFLELERMPRITIPTSAWEVLPGSMPIAIDKLTRLTCRWPVSTAHKEQHYCGLHVGSTVYCIVHAEKSFTKPNNPKRLESATLFYANR